MRRAGVLFCLAAMMWLAAPQVRCEEILDNAAVVRMVRAGLSAELIEMKVKTTAGRFDVTTDGLIALKAAGVPDIVMAAMLKKESTVAAAPTPASKPVPPVPAATQATTPPPAASTTPSVVAVQQTVPVVVAIADTQPVCAKLAYEVAEEKSEKRKAGQVCVEGDAFTIEGQRIPFTSVVAHCRERSIGFPYTSDPDEWRFADGARTYRVFGSERELSPIIAAASSRATAVPGGNCSSREMQKKLPLR